MVHYHIHIGTPRLVVVVTVIVQMVMVVITEIVDVTNAVTQVREEVQFLSLRLCLTAQ